MANPAIGDASSMPSGTQAILSTGDVAVVQGGVFRPVIGSDVVGPSIPTGPPTTDDPIGTFRTAADGTTWTKTAAGSGSWDAGAAGSGGGLTQAQILTRSMGA
jgi:hypothetical protein